MEHKTSYGVVITTCSTEEDAQKIINPLLSLKLAACIQIFKIKSFYTWEGSVNKDDEFILLIKSRFDLYEEIEKCIRENHTYDIPEIIQLPITDGSDSYLDWIQEVSKK